MQTAFRVSEVENMTDAQRAAIAGYRRDGYGYKKISQLTGVCESTVKTYCRRNGLVGSAEEAPLGITEKSCLCCGRAVVQHPGRKEKKFCSDACRNRWWNAHLDQVERRAFYSFTCAGCGKPFESYGNRHRKYCSRGCAENARRADGR